VSGPSSLRENARGLSQDVAEMGAILDSKRIEP
jgi:hypothetical protein